MSDKPREDWGEEDRDGERDKEEEGEEGQEVLRCNAGGKPGTVVVVTDSAAVADLGVGRSRSDP